MRTFAVVLRDRTRFNMYEHQQVYSNTLYIMVYGGSMIFALIASIYLLFRRSNAIAPEVAPPLRLRRWVAAFFAVMVMSHLSWFMLVRYSRLFGDPLINLVVAAALDCVVLIPLIMGMLLNMLQDRHRPLWPFILASLPVVALFAAIIYRHDTTLVSWVQGYFMVMTIVIIIYMAYAVRQYSLWLRNNYADLEHKEVWQSFMVMVICLLILSFYIYSSSGMTYEYTLQVFDYLFVVILLWRVETLQTLENNDDNDDITQTTDVEMVAALHTGAPQTTFLVTSDCCWSSIAKVDNSTCDKTSRSANSARLSVPTAIISVCILHDRIPPTLYQWPAHPALRASLSRGCRYQSPFHCPATGSGERFQELQHFCNSLQTAYGEDGHDVDARE